MVTKEAFSKTSAGRNFLQGEVFPTDAYLDYILTMKDLKKNADTWDAIQKYDAEIEATVLVMGEIEKFKV